MWLRETMLEDSRLAIMRTIREVYQDVTTTRLDRRAAVRIISELERQGWLDPATVRSLVAAAGGKIEITDQALMDPPEELLLHRDFDPPGYTIRTRRVVRLD